MRTLFEYLEKQREYIYTVTVARFGHQVTFVGKLQDAMFMQIGVKTPRKYNLLEIFAQITEPASSSKLCTETEGCVNSVLYLSMTHFIVFIPIIFEGFSCVSRLHRTLPHNIFVRAITFK